MPRKRKSDQPAQEPAMSASTAVMETPPDTSGATPKAMTEQPVTMSPSESASSEPSPTFVERLSERSGRPLMPDPFLIALDNAAGVRLYENRQARVVALQFDAKPSQPLIDTIKEAGFRWNPADVVWTKPVRGDSAISTRIDAERLYQQLCQAIRQDKGLGETPDIPF